MLAKKIANRASATKAARRFGPRINYVCAKARAIETANLAGDWQDAARQMDFAAGLNPYLRSPVLHLVLSWSEFENPSDAEMIDSMHRVIAELGGSEHQYVVGVHANRSTLHVHGIVNRVHAVAGDALSLSHDYARMEKACRRIEVEMGWPQDRGRFDCTVIDGDVHLMPKPAEHWDRKIEERKKGIRRDGRAVRGREKRTGMPALRDAIPTSVMDHIRKCMNLPQDWEEVHSTLADHGLRYVLYRSGARIARIGRNWTMAASHLGSAYGLGPMQSRLGAYVAAREGDGHLPQNIKASGLVSELSGALKIVESQRLEHCRQRDKLKLARREIEARQTKMAKRTHSRLSGRRTVMAQAVRRIMRQDFHKEIITWESDTRAIRQSRFDVTLELEKLAPDIMRLRRYRQALRKLFQDAGTMRIPPDFLDHTYLRQEWALAPNRNPPDLPEQLGALLTRLPDDIRADTHGNLMMAKRNRRGSVVGYDVVDQAVFAVVETAKSDGDGIGLLGPRDAEAVIIVSDAKAAVLQASLGEDPEPLIITVQQDLSPNSAHHLKELAKGRNCFIALGQAKETKDFRAHIAALLPQARDRKRTPDELLDYVARTGLEVLTEDGLDAFGAVDDTPFDPGQEF